MNWRRLWPRRHTAPQQPEQPRRHGRELSPADVRILARMQQPTFSAMVAAGHAELSMAMLDTPRVEIITEHDEDLVRLAVAAGAMGALLVLADGDGAEEGSTGH